MRSITKTIVIAASAVALCFGLAACSGGQSASSDNSTSSNNSASSEKTAPAAQEESKAVDFYMFKGEMPEGYGLTGPNGNSSPLNIVEFAILRTPTKSLISKSTKVAPRSNSIKPQQKTNIPRATMPNWANTRGRR